MRPTRYFAVAALAGLYVASLSCGTANKNTHETTKVETSNEAETPNKVETLSAPVGAEGALSSKLLAGLSVMALGESSPVEELDLISSKLADGTLTNAQLIEDLLNKPAFGQKVVPMMVFRGWTISPSKLSPFWGWTLKKQDSEGKVLYYLRRPCKAAEAVEVRPWWDLDKPILVCPDSYRPEVREIVPKQSANGKKLYCSALLASPPLEKESVCGCGPNLLRCTESSEHIDEVRDSTRGELAKTIGYIVEQDLPASEILTSQGSFRDRNVEAIYRRWRMEAGEDVDLSDLASWPEGGKFAPRYESQPHQHAGFATMPRVVHSTGDRRLFLNYLYHFMWCKDVGSFGATPEKLLALGSTDLQGPVNQGWQKISKMDTCTDCHARMDYGIRFFQGYPNSASVGRHFIEDLVPHATGPFYANNIADQRGEGELTPVGWAKLVSDQSEFSQCMVNDVTDYVFGHRATTEDRERVAAAYAQKPTFKSMMSAALTRYLETPWPSAVNVAAIPKELLPFEDSDKLVPLSEELMELLDDNCTSCHDPGTMPLVGSELPRRFVTRALDHVAQGLMPKGETWALDERTEFIKAAARTLWQDQNRQKAAMRYYGSLLKTLPVQQIDGLMNSMHSIAGVDPESNWRINERNRAHRDSSLTPTVAAILGVEALRTCALGNKSEKEIDACMEELIDLDAFIKARPE